MARHRADEVFGSDYEKNAHLQKGFNPHLLDDLVDYILRMIPESQSRPIRLMDLCCGDGGSTALLLQKLDAKNILVESLVGYDISPLQIAIASGYARLDQRLRFEVKDINALTAEGNIDVILSLFGLHWVEDMSSIAPKIKRCLTPQGLFMFFVPLEKNELLALRHQLLHSHKWADKFTGFALKGFVADSREYFDAIAPYFICENEGGIDGEQDIPFVRGRFAEFLSSWMPELRHLQTSEEQQAYVADLIDSIPASAEKYPDVKPIVTVNGELGIQFLERFSWFHLRNKMDESAYEPSATIAFEREGEFNR